MDINNILSADLSNTDIQRHLLSKGAYELDITDVKQEENSKGTGDNIVISLATAFPGTSQLGKPLNPGFKIIHNISLTETEKYDMQSIARNLKLFRMAATGQESGAFGPLEQYIGKRVTANINIEVDKTGQYGDKNVIGRWIPKNAKPMNTGL